jgi:hypothetical protein
MSWPETWPTWQPQPGPEDPGRGGMSQLAAYEAGLTDNPGCWVQPIEVYWSPRLDPRSPEYDPDFAAAAAWEEPSPAEAQALAESHQSEPEAQAGPEPDAWPEPELPF